MRSPVVLAAFFAVSTASFGQQLIVTAEGRHGSPAPEVAQDDISVELNKAPARVESWTPLRGDDANLELYIVIDDGDDTDLGLQYASLKSFINEQPAATQIGLAYLRNGAAYIAAPLIADRAQLEKAFRIPLGQPGISSSPYMGISDLIKKWPDTTARREVLLIASGADPWSPADPENIYLRKAIADAQRGGILINSIYYGEAGHLGHSYWRVNWGENYLSILGDETGGEAYWQGTIKPVSFEPFLKDLSTRLGNQYRLTFVGGSGDAKGGLQPVKVTSSKSGLSLVAASKIAAASKIRLAK